MHFPNHKYPPEDHDGEPFHLPKDWPAPKIPPAPDKPTLAPDAPAWSEASDKIATGLAASGVDPVTGTPPLAPDAPMEDVSGAYRIFESVNSPIIQTSNPLW